MTETLSSGLNRSQLTYFLSIFPLVQITRSFTPLETTQSINIAAAEPGVLISVSSTVFQHILMCMCQLTKSEMTERGWTDACVGLEGIK